LTRQPLADDAVSLPALHEIVGGVGAGSADDVDDAAAMARPANAMTLTTLEIRIRGFSYFERAFVKNTLILTKEQSPPRLCWHLGERQFTARTVRRPAPAAIQVCESDSAFSSRLFAAFSGRGDALQ
jgi:hypothetical protein